MFFPLKDNMPKLTFPLVTFVLIALNVAIYFMASSNPLAATNAAIFYGVIPYEVTNPGMQCVPLPDMSAMTCGTEAEIAAMYPGLELPSTWLTVATSMFLHGGLFHLISNMLFLFVFGGALENALGRLSFGLFYLVGGVAAVLGQTLWDTGEMMPMVGASGAIASVLAGYVILFPSAKIIALLIIIPMRVRAIIVIGTWLFFQFVDAYISAGEGDPGGIAFWAHIGGFAAGAALTYLMVDKEQIAGFRREARLVSGLMVEPLQPYQPTDNTYHPPPPPPPPPQPGVAQPTAPYPAVAPDPFAVPPQHVMAPDPFAVPQQAQRPPAM